MLEKYRTVYVGGEGELVEKKSRFIATVIPAQTEEEALSFIERTRKKYWDARHNCYAYTVGLNREYTRASDDGEPAQTAGRPMLDVLLGQELYNTAVVVTRYFGGVLLGTGGLVRAYSGAVQKGIEASQVIEKIHGLALRVHTDYNGYGKITYLANMRGYEVLDTVFTDEVAIRILMPVAEEGSARKAITECTSGRARVEKEEELYFAKGEEGVLTFPLT